MPPIRSCSFDVAVRLSVACFGLLFGVWVYAWFDVASGRCSWSKSLVEVAGLLRGCSVAWRWGIRCCPSGASPFCASNNGIAVPANNQTTVRRRADPTRTGGAPVRSSLTEDRHSDFASDRNSDFAPPLSVRSKVIMTSRNLCGLAAGGPLLPGTGAVWRRRAATSWEPGSCDDLGLSSRSRLGRAAGDWHSDFAWRLSVGGQGRHHDFQELVPFGAWRATTSRNLCGLAAGGPRLQESWDELGRPARSHARRLARSHARSPARSHVRSPAEVRPKSRPWSGGGRAEVWPGCPRPCGRNGPTAQRPDAKPPLDASDLGQSTPVPGSAVHGPRGMPAPCVENAT
jgi:hypothetical protein